MEFGTWFGVKFDGPFVAGAPVWGTITPTKMDEEIAREQKPYEGMRFQVFVDRIEPESAFSFRWNPSGADQKFDASKDPMTLVSFTLHQTPEGVLLKVTESGFDAVSARPPCGRVHRQRRRLDDADGRRSGSILRKRHRTAAAVGAPAAIFAALGDATRLRLISRLSDDGPQSIASLAADFDISRQAISKHLRVMSDAGLATMRPARPGDRVATGAGRARGCASIPADDLADWDEKLQRLKHLVEPPS